MRKICSAAAAFTMAVGPWLALLASAGGPHGQTLLAAGDPLGWAGTSTLVAAPATPDDPGGGGRFVVGECTCRDITVNASNQVSDATVDVHQDANAQSGDAIAGQVLGIAGGGGCTHITVNAQNVVSNSDVQS